MNIPKSSRGHKGYAIIRMSATEEFGGIWTAGLEIVIDKCGEGCIAGPRFAHGVDGEVGE